MKPADRVMANVQVSEMGELIAAVDALGPYIQTFRIDTSESAALGIPHAFNEIHERGRQVFFDCRLHEDPGTMADTAIELAQAKIAFFSIHASAGMAAMRAAVINKGDCKVLAVTVPPHFSGTDCERIYGVSLKTKTIQLAHEAETAGVDGLVCSAAQMKILRDSGEFDDTFIVVTDILPSPSSEEKRRGLLSAYDAISGGADAIVVSQLTADLYAVGAEVTEAGRSALSHLMGAVQLGLGEVSKRVGQAATGVGKAKAKVGPGEE
ncbi:MAG: orotidine 5'-phosphate decarboxylase / HUMPS family protein [Patescibacteria group bacterium]